MTTIDAIINQWFKGSFGTENEWAGVLILIVLSLLLAILLSGAIGFEREYHGHSAGLRTHILVALGSAIVMVISYYGFSAWDAAEKVRDPARLAAQVVSGIGFLGAGTIIQTGTDIKGLTTATTLWLVMGIGLAAGSGNFVIAICATLLSLLVLVALRPLERRLAKKNPVITVVVSSDHPIMRDLINIASHYGISLRDIDSQLVKLPDGIEALRITIRTAKTSKNSITSFIMEIKDTIKPIEVRLANNNTL